ncbi:PLP-dependent aminotransferase family protein [Myroides sp. NP-2]|uniref:MocR-like pyridoxine biosynthesis transcription factor PdxR n=1 Tax=Myroides sp. NP-2 TaxID=2759945 RepID=UPI0015FC0453|nr:PLP-dependent aminotransferase family protein [Myroides sp. NP-2]MBB1151387.1 PLP-dependent aminotransferase family protein [Myroides sp. NP-2]
MMPFERIISIDRKSKIPIYRQIAISFINAISQGVIKANTHLPSTRDLAKLLEVHRKTIVAAYEELEAQDWVVSVPRKYVAVSAKIPQLKPKKWSEESANESSYTTAFQPAFKQITSPKIKEIARLPSIILDDGFPDVRLSPIDDLLKIYRSYTSKKHSIRNATFGTAQGSLKLREILASYLSETRGLNIEKEHILITHGAQMSIYLAAQLLLEPGECIVVGRPNYDMATKVFEQTGATVLEVNVDDNGLVVSEVESICQSKPIKAIYVIPHHHYPTTVTLSIERRMALLKLSQQYGFAIIEDDYDYDYHYASSPYLPLASSQHRGHVIYIGSFSKLLDPSIRIGFMVAPFNFIEQGVALRKLIDVGVDGYMQNALAELIRQGELKRHIKKAKKCYFSRRDYLDELLRLHLASSVDYTLLSGGMAIWLTLKKPYVIEQLMTHPQLAIKRVDTELNAFRFGFASMNEQELEQAVLLLKTIIGGEGVK